MISNWLPWALIVAAAANSTIGNLLLKKSRSTESDTIFDLILNPWFAGGALFYVINVILFSKALRSLPVSTAYPVMAGIGFLLLALSAWVLFDERLYVSQWIGMLFVLFGIALLARLV